MEIRSLKQDELEQWFDHCLYVFNGGEYSASYRQYFANHWYNDPWRDLDGILVAAENGKILSTVRIFSREIYINGERISMGGIGEVSTKPEARGKGLSTGLLQIAIKKMEDRGIKVSMLAAGIQDYYRRLGWETLHMYSKVSDLKGCGDSQYTVRPVNLDTDIDCIREIYSRYSIKFNGPLVRDNREYWEKWFKTEKGSAFAAQDSEGRMISYICADAGDNRVNIKEFGALPGFDGVFPYLASKAADLMGKTGCEAVYKGVKNPGMDVKRVDADNYIMIRLITPFEIKGRQIKSTQQLINMMEGSNVHGEDSEFVFWGIDGF